MKKRKQQELSSTQKLAEGQIMFVFLFAVEHKFFSNQISRQTIVFFTETTPLFSIYKKSSCKKDIKVFMHQVRNMYARSYSI